MAITREVISSENERVHHGGTEGAERGFQVFDWKRKFFSVDFVSLW
jgi:hypothetical protein